LRLEGFRSSGIGEDFPIRGLLVQAPGWIEASGYVVLPGCGSVRAGASGAIRVRLHAAHQFPCRAPVSLPRTSFPRRTGIRQASMPFGLP
jgi:hypothetical protein